ncbi:bifunctional methylenetetrahydrofolate dehydrogenase/methenyltetrahydrofolate cyclohydrolase [Bdellovibrio sp. qaytius]|nr:bifunctional methylenetetrahydrofolate dehydrogenase/methenyltetrahydrofolate cyclohydrolase [Bdellovibrio sp. qaytius]
MKLLKGQPVSEKIQADIKTEIASWPTLGLALPHLSVILVGNDAASQVYVGHKARMCEALGFSSEVIRLDENTTEAQLLAKIDELNKNSKVDGILVQLPLPKQIHERTALEKISPLKDVDCLTKTNIGSMVVGDAIVKPCTPAGIIEILKFYDIKIAGKKIAVIGRSQIVGTPLVHLLTQENATVTLFHSKSENLMHEIKMFDIVCVAIGKSEYFKATDFKQGAIVIDVGIHRSENHKLTGDVTKTPEGDNWLSAQSPVPGGVGVTTIAMLMQNTLQACKARRQS